MRYVATTRIAPAPPPRAAAGWLARARRLFFNSPASAAASVTLALVTVVLGWKFVQWGVMHALFSTRGSGPQACRAEGVGACWAVVGDKLRLILFGIYPYDQQWRAAAAVLV